MSLTPTAEPDIAAGPRRVRHQARDVVVIGALNRVEIWDPDRIAAWEDEHSQTFADMSEDVFPA